MQVPTSFLLSLPFFSRALGLAISPRHVLYGRSNSGIATFYGGNLQGGACGFSTMTSLPSGVYGTATANWDSAAHCGQCASVTRSGGSTITVMVWKRHWERLRPPCANKFSPDRGSMPWLLNKSARPIPRRFQRSRLKHRRRPN